MKRTILPFRNNPVFSGFSQVAATRIDAICDLGGGVVVLGTRDTIEGRIYRSTDYGKTWTLVQTLTGTTPSIFCIATSDDGYAYALTWNADLWRSTDAGMTWTFASHVSTPTPEVAGYSYGVIVASGGAVLVTDTNNIGGRIWRSTDHGSTWTLVLTASSRGLYRLQDVGDGIIANGWGGAIYKGSADGSTWGTADTISSDYLYALAYLGDGVAFTADVAGRMFKSIENGDFGTWVQIAQPDGSADDAMSLGNGRMVYTTYTSKKAVYASDHYGDCPRSLGAISTVAGDWVDHLCAIQEPGRQPRVIATTNRGYVGFID